LLLSPCIAQLDQRWPCEADCTPETVRFTNDSTVLKLGGPEEEVKSKVRDVHVMNARILIEAEGTEPPAVAEALFFPPLVLGGSTAATLLHAEMTQLLQTGLDLQDLAKANEIVFWMIGEDAASSNILKTDFLDERLPKNTIMMRYPCALHASNRIVVDHFTKSGFDIINPIYSMILLLQVGGNFEDFAGAVINLAGDIDEADWNCTIEPDFDCGT